MVCGVSADAPRAPVAAQEGYTMEDFTFSELRVLYNGFYDTCKHSFGLIKSGAIFSKAFYDEFRFELRTLDKLSISIEKRYKASDLLEAIPLEWFSV